MNINDLNDDCLKQVFSWLSFRDKVKCQRVCKLWKTIIFQVFTQQLFFKTTDSFERCTSETLSLVLKKVIKYCINLKAIEINDSSIDENILQMVFNKLKRLNVLWLRNRENFNKSLLKVFINCKNSVKLTELHISNQNIDDNSLEVVIKNCPHLKFLNVSKNDNITGKSSLQYLSSSLKSLDISECRYIREDGFQCLISGEGTNLSELKFGTYVSKQIIENISKNLKSLTKLHINAYYYPKSFISDDLSSISRLERLEHLYVHNLLPLLQNNFDNTFSQILIGLNKLKTLSLIVTQISDNSLKYLAKYCPKLESFEYQYSSYKTVVNTDLTDEGALYLSQIKSLRKLSITGTAFTEKSLSHLIQHNSSLVFIYLSNCKNISESNIISLIKQREANCKNKIFFEFN